MSAEAALEFLKQLRPGGPWVLTSINPTNAKAPTETTTATNAEQALEFIRANDGNRNLYYSVNATRDQLTKKAAKTDIAAIEYLLADLDPRKGEAAEAAKARYLAELEKHQPAPTAIIDSGNGIQALWKLAKPIKLAKPLKDAKGKPVFSPETETTVAGVEARIAALMRQLGSVAGTQNIDRVFRLPGTTNLPNKKKLKEGRTACPAKLLRFNGATCALTDFPEGDEPPEASANIETDSLPLPKRIQDLIRGIDDPEHPYESRSEAVFAVILAMQRAGCSNEQIKAILLNPSNPISAHILEQAQPEKYLTRQIKQAQKKGIDETIAKLNHSYALVIVGDKTSIMKFEAGGSFKFINHSAFELWHANKFVYYQDRNGDQKKIPLAKYWMHHPQRRQYEGLVFAPGRELPGHFNLWRGFAVKPQPGDCSRFLAHLRDNVCSRDSKLFLWVQGWLAQIVQHPDKKMGTSLVLRGKQGTGKTKVGQVIGSLLGEHYALVSDPRYVTGRFNSHLVSCLLLHCDESFWAGDHAAEGKLKDLITGEHHFIEFKSKEPIKMPNYVRLLVTGNPDWLVPAGFEERRFAVLDVGEEHIQDGDYFAAIDAEMENGGREALLHHLLNFDLAKVDLRSIPTTAALVEQKLSSLTPEQGWWWDTLARGELPWGMSEADKCPAPRLFDRYIAHASRRGARRRSIETQLGIFLRNHIPGLQKGQGTYIVRPSNYTGGSPITTQGYVYSFPPLDECRAAFAQLLHQEIAWPEKEGWTTEPPPEPE